MAELDSIIADFEFLDDWDDRYRYLIELGNRLEPLRDGERNEAAKVQGCASQVWLHAEIGAGPDPAIRFRGDSDAHIVRGLVAVALALFSGRRASEILATDEAALFERLRLREHISTQRSNGLRALVARIRQEARSALTA